MTERIRVIQVTYAAIESRGGGVVLTAVATVTSEERENNP